MEQTGRYELPLLMPSQAQKHVTHNEALTLIDGLMHPSIKSFSESAPPVGVAVDDMFFVGPSASGDWFGESGKLAIFTDMGWRFAAVRQGMIAQDSASGLYVNFDGTAWQPLADALDFSAVPALGINTNADSTNRLAVRSNAALLTAVNAGDGGNGDMRVTVNKEAAVDTASLVFQTGFSGRAEFGLAGDDDFRVKVSANGSAWTDALTINRLNGQVTLAGNSVGNAALADVASATIKGRASAGTGDPEDLTAAQATALLNPFTTALKGVTPASGGGTVNFLRADGTWAIPAGGGGSSAWGGINGTLSAQADLQAALDAKSDSSHAHAIADISGLQAALDNPISGFAFKPASTFWISQSGSETTLTTLGGAANRIDLMPFRAAFTFTADALGVLCSTAVASALGKILVYASDADGRPDALILETGTLDFATTGFKSVSVSQTFTKGTRYWFGIRHSSTATLNAHQIYTVPTLHFLAVPTTAPQKLLRRTLAFATVAPATWGYNAAEAVSAGPTAIFMRTSA
jgi:hypothetical protein